MGRIKRRLAVDVEEASAFFAVATSAASRRFVGRTTRRLAFGERFAAFRFGGDPTTGRDSLRVAKTLVRGGTRRDFCFATKFGGSALRRKDKGVGGDVHSGVP